MIGSLAAFFAPVIKEALLAAHPVGSVYISFEATDPGLLYLGAHSIRRIVMINKVFTPPPENTDNPKFGGASA